MAKYSLVRFDNKDYLNTSSKTESSPERGEIVLKANTCNGFMERIMRDGVDRYYWQVHHNERNTGAIVCYSIGTSQVQKNENHCNAMVAELVKRMMNTADMIKGEFESLKAKNQQLSIEAHQLYFDKVSKKKLPTQKT